MKLHISTRKGLFDFSTGASAGVVGRHFVGDNVTLSLTDARNGYRYAAFNHGHFGVKLKRSQDAGATWQDIPSPAYPIRPEGTPDEIGADGRPLPWTLKLIWSMETGGADQPGRLWCGTIPGGLFRSDDHGDSWQLVEGFWRHPDRLKWFGGGADYPGIHSICVDPRDSRVIRVGVSCGGVWQSDDDGATWNNRSHGMFAAYMPPEQKFDVNIQDPHRMVQCKSMPDYLWVQHHNGVFASTDGSRSWKSIDTVQPSVFGFAVVVDPKDGNNAWTVPASSDQFRIPVEGRVVVSHTTDGGKTWRMLTKGLPQEDAYDLTFRHSLAISNDGKTLAFGSTTGSLWISHDRGESWQTLSQHLPPIYAVAIVEV